LAAVRRSFSDQEGTGIFEIIREGKIITVNLPSGKGEPGGVF
jgi:hypothetical protein